MTFRRHRSLPTSWTCSATGHRLALGFDPAAATRRFDYRIDRLPGFVRGRPGVWWAINGGLYPNIPMFVVQEGDVARVKIENRSTEAHPMHLHGHRLLVLARNGVPATGSPWWVDSLHVRPGETFDVAFVGRQSGHLDGPLPPTRHAEEGMVAHLMYEGFDTPFRIGGSVGQSAGIDPSDRHDTAALA